MGVSRPQDFDICFLNIFHVEMVAAILAQVFFILLAWQAYIRPGRLHQSWNDEQIYDFYLKICAVLNGLC